MFKNAILSFIESVAGIGHKSTAYCLVLQPRGKEISCIKKLGPFFCFFFFLLLKLSVGIWVLFGFRMGWRYKTGLLLIAAVVIIWVTSAEVTQVSSLSFKFFKGFESEFMMLFLFSIGLSYLQYKFLSDCLSISYSYWLPILLSVNDL